MNTSGNKGVVVAFDGEKYFWKTRTSVDVVIAFHTALDVYEIIVYRPALNKEMTRMYLCGKAVYSVIDHGAIGCHLKRTGGGFVSDLMIANATNKVVSEFVLARLLLSETNQLTIQVQHQDQVSKANPTLFLVCAKPPALKEFKTQHIA